MKRKTARKKKNNNNYTFKGGFFGRKISPEDEVPKRKLYDILKDAERKYREKVKSQEKDAKVKGLAKKKWSAKHICNKITRIRDRIQGISTPICQF